MNPTDPYRFLIAVRFILFFSLIAFNSYAQGVNISGYITDDQTGEALIGANLYASSSGSGVSANEYGYYIITAEPDTFSVTISYVGYTTKNVRLYLQKDTILNIQLAPDNLLATVVVRESKTQAVGNQPLTIPIRTLENMPAIAGETDLLKSLSFLPGVSMGQEGSSNLYIRGGTPDQNLILLDGIPVYNATHLGGFFSVFNTKAINNVDLYKSNFPARYGGRLSSVIDITMKEGNREKFTGNFGLGLLTTSAALEGPIKKEKSSYLITARTSYLGLINIFRKKENAETYFDYWLYDINAKINYKLKKGHLYLSAYTGNDDGVNFNNSKNTSGVRVLSENKEENNVKWGNTTLSSRYVLPIGKKMFGKFLIGYSQYKYKFRSSSINKEYLPDETLVEEIDYQNTSSVNDILIQANFDYAIGARHFLKYGIGITFHRFGTGSGKTPDGLDTEKKYNSTSCYGYVEDQITFGKKWSSNVGLRWSQLTVGQKTYAGFEPRLALEFQPLTALQFHTSFSTTRQYIHLLTNTGFGFPNDIWVPATENTPPQDAFQFTLGGKINITPVIELTVDAYYKEMNQLIDYKVGADNLFTQVADWESLIERNGSGQAYGIEWLLQKTRGRMSGFLAYTLAWNNRQFDNISRGQVYPFTYDRRHDFSVVFQYKISEKWRVSANWIFQTGTAVTLPVGLFPLPSGETTGEIFIGRNNGRLPKYHRLDGGVNYHKTTKRSNKLIWKLSVYNLYDRKNTSFLLVDTDPVFDADDRFLYLESDIQQVSLFSFIPAVSLEYKF